MKKLPKMEDLDLLNTLRNAEKKGFYRFVDHAQMRLTQREVTVAEVRQIMREGFHEKKKDEWKEAYSEWNYAFRGKTIDGRDIRIAVAVKAPDLLIITVIDLSKKNVR
jgi:hypothetical protein